MPQNQSTIPKLKLQSADEALFVACRMEESAIALYQRAMMICPAEMVPTLESILNDEKSHLCRFRSFGTTDALSTERMIELSVCAEQLLYEGGLLGATRDGLLASKDSLLRLAASSEATSIQKYRSFAALTQGETKQALLLIAQEEERHLNDLQKYLQD